MPDRISYNIPPTNNYATGTSPKETNSFDIQVGDLIVVVSTWANMEGATHTAVTPSLSGGAATWSAKSTIGSGNSSMSGGAAWYGTVTTAATNVTITLNKPCSNVSYEWGYSATVVRNHGGIGQFISGDNGAGGSGAPSITVTTAANSLLIMQFNDWNAGTGASRVWRSVNGSPMTESAYYFNNQIHTVYGGYAPDTGAAGSETVGLTAPATQRWIGLGYEILAAPAGGEVPALQENGFGILLENGVPLLF